ncbi:MAG: terminase [Thiohalospira sp.]
MANRTKFTTERQERFLEALRKIPIVTFAAHQAGVSRRTVYDHRDQDPAFARQWDEALEEGMDLVELEAHRRAVHGVQEPVVSKGEIITYVTKYSDALLGRLLQAYRPEKFSDKHQHQVTPGDPVRQALAAIDGTTLGPPSERPGAILPEPEGPVYNHIPPGLPEDDEENA